MTDARTWTPPDHAEIRALLPTTQRERNELAARIGVRPRLMRYWWSGGRTPSYALWRLLVAEAKEKDDDRRVPRY